ncbi:MAG: hypothetical protein G01um101448_776 [Parcubacteria group bacterium Gr01-1014_48]|nr:MAG: hypothetical protein Greene041614_589 [Parcubacteria group bacterium Greene0416_14]TSC73424.1 MAG: hypothetical protein G01um101448_776 [Parcubacteria group bacterium Gr01-1014_48]TSD00837.1 MAG: hypothetical protein Greene101415_638 [Parcubacteria group bacterium Greene1014_15]TSD07052.1 MAG: hypothetical protein Greene07144_1016 [Parcubacteria group bacterium Greene0714_4]
MIKKVILRPSRIGCPSLPGTMKGIVVSVPGVTDVDVHYEERALAVTFDDALTSVSAITKKIGEEMGIAMTEGDELSKGGESASETCPM